MADPTHVFVVHEKWSGSDKRDTPTLVSEPIKKLTEKMVKLDGYPSGFPGNTFPRSEVEFTAEDAICRYIRDKRRTIADAEDVITAAERAIVEANALLTQVPPRTDVPLLLVASVCSICGNDNRPARCIPRPGDQDDAVLCHLCDTPENEALVGPPVAP